MKKHSAFSLMELSISIVIIGILIAGVTQGGTIIKKSKLTTARTLTKGAPVSSIDNLMLWYETSLESSFDSSSQKDGKAISAWYDNGSGTQNSLEINATQTTTSAQPKFYKNVFNGGIPAIRFDGTDDYLSFDGSQLVGTSYTIFVVEQRRTASGRYFFGGSSVSASNTNLHFGYATSTLMRLGHYNANLDYTISSYSSPTPRIHTGRLQVGSSRDYWLNGGITADVTNSTASYTIALVSYADPALGRTTEGSGSTVYFNGDIAEIIIYTRDLETTERQAVEDYLSKKYGIKIS